MQKIMLELVVYAAEWSAQLNDLQMNDLMTFSTGLNEDSFFILVE
jgi:hypothetical protein